MTNGPGETSSLLDHNISDVDEHEVVSYVQLRRASIMSQRGDKMLPNFAAPANRTDRLTSVRSHASFHDVRSLLSQHSLIAEPETDVNTEIFILLKYSFPLVLTFLLQYSLTVASIFSVGRLGSNELAAVSLSSMTANISAYAIFQGVSTCLDTLCAQSYGKKDFEAVGIHYMKCNYFLLLIYIPVFILWVFGSEPILYLIVGDEPLCHLASKYLKILVIGVPGFILFENSKHFLQCQGVFHASTYVLAVCAPINAFLNYILVWDKRIGLGFIGAPLSVVITNYLMCISLMSYIFFVRGHECWPKGSIFNVKYFKNWNKMISLSIPGVLLVEAEWLAFEIITFSASRFGTAVLAAQSIVSTSCVLLYQVPFAFSIAASTRIAWFIGAASKKAAVKATRAAMISALFVGVFDFAVLFFLRTDLAQLYSRDSAVIKIASKVLIVGALYQFNDSISCASGGILRGQGRQKIAGILNLICYYCVALPLAFLCAFHFHLELLGLWLGMIVALFLISILQSYFVLKSDWDQIIDDCINEGVSDGINIEAHSLVPSMSSSHIY
ncbi:uncharacterized protein PRCAT00003741001 [Priceomyces carsonii]|uniref:uncharacterized protein n=1 Tax=Priceomyces carsonii TaxID=28549 RepID=UPI002ED7BBD0|nr:unnamed protein product [Priceomyces carsonii]